MKPCSYTPPVYTRNSREAMRRKRRVTLLICAAGVLATWAGMVGLYLMVRGAAVC